MQLRPAQRDELARFWSMERQSHARKFINDIDLETHKAHFTDPEIIYLTICDDEGKIAGFFILALEDEENSVEFRRIVIDQYSRGIGKQAIMMMEEYCRTELVRETIWLDVYEDNEIGRHVYESLDYLRFDEKDVGGRKLLFYRKSL